jgi:hypothetical protein
MPLLPPSKTPGIGGLDRGEGAGLAFLAALLPAVETGEGAASRAEATAAMHASREP